MVDSQNVSNVRIYLFLKKKKKKKSLKNTLFEEKKSLNVTSRRTHFFVINLQKYLIKLFLM